MTQNSDLDSTSTDYVFVEARKDAPRCPHGPTLLFEKKVGGKEGRRFFACSACRNRKDCRFFQWEDEKVSEKKKEIHDIVNKVEGAPFTHDQFTERYELIKDQEVLDRKFCHTCGLFVMNDEHKAAKYKDHNIQHAVGLHQMQVPTKLLHPLTNVKKEAQYMFSPATSKFMVETLKTLGFDTILCIGTPRIFELIQTKYEDINALLLDIDYRYCQFYDGEQFCVYNLFNHHFFGGKKSKKVYHDFLHSAEPGKLAVLMDPPFGGLVEPIALTLKKIVKDFNKDRSDTCKDELLPTFFVFPYFMEPHVKLHLPSLTMLDYKVNYENTPFTNKRSKENKKGSPVRIFTNIEPSKVVLPDEGYRFCKPCKRYVYSENKHCGFCKACTSKDGSTYVHCKKCSQCVKPSRVHCDACEKCLLPDHFCGEKVEDQQGTSCFGCGKTGHKRKQCPQRSHVKPFRAKKRKVEVPAEPQFPRRNKKQRREKKWIKPKFIPD